MPSLGLRVRSILDLEPRVPVVLVNAEFSLRHNSLHSRQNAWYPEKTLTE